METVGKIVLGSVLVATMFVSSPAFALDPGADTAKARRTEITKELKSLGGKLGAIRRKYAKDPQIIELQKAVIAAQKALSAKLGELDPGYADISAKIADLRNEAASLRAKARKRKNGDRKAGKANKKRGKKGKKQKKEE